MNCGEREQEPRPLRTQSYLTARRLHGDGETGTQRRRQAS